MMWDYNLNFIHMCVCVCVCVREKERERCQHEDVQVMYSVFVQKMQSGNRVQILANAVCIHFEKGLNLSLLSSIFD